MYPNTAIISMKVVKVNNMIKTCKFCGKAFESNTSKQYCDGDHFKVCEICGAEFKVPNHRLADKNLTCCSRKCSSTKRSKAIKAALHLKPEGYNAHKTQYSKVCKVCGLEFVTNIYNQEICDRKHYRKCSVCGKEFELTKDGIFNKTETCSEECRQEKSRQTSLERYGVEYYTQTDEFIRSQIANKDEIAKKRRATNLERYGREYYSHTPEYLQSLMRDSECIDNLMEFNRNPREFIETYFLGTKPTILQLSNLLGINTSSAGDRVHKYQIEDMIDFRASTIECEVVEYLKLIVPDIEIIKNDRTVISPYELDIYLPEYRIAIECNPTSTHNSTFNCFSLEEAPLTSTYHKDKTDRCLEKNIKLLHLFGYEWNNKKDIMKSIIKSKLGLNDRIFARNCTLCEISDKECSEFLDANHRQGNVSCSIRLGLYYRDELVSVMTFSKIRKLISKSSTNVDGYELVRFCSKLNTVVVGGASKLFKYFLKTYDPKYVISYQDRATMLGNLYQTLRFRFKENTNPGYVWVNINTDKYLNRIQTQKHNLGKMFSGCDLTKSESQILQENKYVKVYNSGNSVWEYFND